VNMRAVWKKNDYHWPRPEHIVPTATITHLAELPLLLRSWGGTWFSQGKGVFCRLSRTTGINQTYYCI